jgi:formate--tetrahydrofolate ligase
LVGELCRTEDIQCIETRVHALGSEGGLELADTVKSGIQERTPAYAYELGAPVTDKLRTLASKIYGAETVAYSPEAKKDIRLWEELGYGNLPLCVAKTQYSFSDDKKLLGAPTGFDMHVREVRLSAGAGFLIPIAGEITTMPGLPRHPASENIDMDKDGNVQGLF